MSELVKLNPLSCERCKSKKVRCGRQLPHCSKCETRQAECVYPKPMKKRRSATTAAKMNGPVETVLLNILQHLQRVEQSGDASSENALYKGPATISPTSDQRQGPAQDSSFLSPANTSQPYTISPISSTAIDHGTNPNLKYMALMQKAFDEVQKRRLQSITVASMMEEVHIPQELAKIWIATYFTYMPSEMFITPDIQKVIEFIPDILDLPHVHLDSSILVAYYSVLYQGCILSIMSTADDNLNNISQFFATKIYVACLRTLPSWQREAKGSITDLGSAIMMTRTAFDFFDYNLCWIVYKQSCEYARVLSLHNLDAGEGLAIFNGSTADKDRKGVWELINLDLFFRLLFNKPPIITASLEDWKVNLPQLSVDVVNQAVPTVVFLFNSRISFIVLRFFQIVEDEKGGDISHRLPEIETLCQEIEDLVSEWDLDAWIRRSTINAIESWMISDSIMMGYTCIIFMLRRMTSSDVTSPKPVSSNVDSTASGYVCSASRHIINLSHFILTKFSYLGTISVLFGFYQCHISYVHLVSNARTSADVEMLEQVADIVATITKDEADFIPLVEALRYFNQEVRTRLGDQSIQEFSG